MSAAVALAAYLAAPFIGKALPIPAMAPTLLMGIPLSRIARRVNGGAGPGVLRARAAAGQNRPANRISRKVPAPVKKSEIFR